jgi:lipid A 3-O-deacylase
MRIKIHVQLSLLVLIVCACPNLAQAQNPSEKKNQAFYSIDRPLQVSLLYENDFFGRTDRNYTSGALLSLAWGKYDDSGNDPSLLERNFSFSIGQQLYTPGSRRRTDVQLNDRPFAAWLFGRWALHTYDTDNSQTLSLDLGVVGPAAGGETSQNFIHGLQGYTRFRGWGNQLRNEAGVLLASEWRREILRSSHWNLIGHYGGGLGNIETYLNTGLRLQFGATEVHDLRMPPSFRPASRVGQVGTNAEPLNRNLQGFVGVDLRAVAHNIFLDGNTWSQSHQVSRKPGVLEISAGLSWRWIGFDFAYTHNLRTREFYGQAYSHAFGGLSISKTLQ